MPEGFYDAADEAPPSPTRSVASTYSFATARTREPQNPDPPAVPSLPSLNDPRQTNNNAAAAAVAQQQQQQQQQPSSVTRQGSTAASSTVRNSLAAALARRSAAFAAANIDAIAVGIPANSNTATNATTTVGINRDNGVVSNALAAALARQQSAAAAEGFNATNDAAAAAAVVRTNSSVAEQVAAALASRTAAVTGGGGGSSSATVGTVRTHNIGSSVAEQLAAVLAGQSAAAVTTGGDAAAENTQGMPTRILFNHHNGGGTNGGQGITIVRGPAGEQHIVLPQQLQSQQAGGAPGQQQQAQGIMSQRPLFNNPHAPTIPGEGITIIRNHNGEQHVVQQRGGRTSIRLPPGARQIRIPVGTSNNVRIVGTATPQAALNGNHQVGNPNVIAHVPIPLLTAQAIPTSSRHLAAADQNDDDGNEDDAELEKYKCHICCEFFVAPSSCGKCASRFCHACLVRVANTRVSNHQSKCPTCRSPLTVGDILLDEALQEEMKQANLQVLCSFRGCKQRLAAATMKEHELLCDFTPMRCKNSTMGCPWHGLRKDVQHHLMAHCQVERVAGVVDQFRHTRADHQTAIVQLQRSQTMVNQMVEVNAGLMRRALPSPTNLFDLINLTYTVSCTPAYFLYTADIWRLFLIQQGAQESRAAIANLLYMIPTVFNVCRAAISGYRLLLSLNAEQDLQLFVDNMELGLLALTPFFLLLTVGLCFLLDGNSSFKWSNYKYFGTWQRTVLRDMATLALFVINIVIIETDDAGIAAVWFWLCVVSATCFFPPIILTVLGSASGISEPNPHQIFSAGRDASVVVFALRHAAIAGFLGFLPAIDAAIIGQLLRRNLLLVVRYDMIPVSDGIYSSIGAEYMAGFLGIRFAMWAIETRFDEVPWITLIASISYPLVNFLVHQLTLLGIKIGSKVFREGRSNVLPNKLGVRNAFSVYGTVSFCLWSSVLLFLAATF